MGRIACTLLGAICVPLAAVVGVFVVLALIVAAQKFGSLFEFDDRAVGIAGCLAILAMLGACLGYAFSGPDR